MSADFLIKWLFAMSQLLRFVAIKWHINCAFIVWWRIMLDISATYSKKNDCANNATIPCIVAGNAPSLAQIDYARMPFTYHTLRCNQFYFEDKYYLGKSIEAVCFADQALFEQIYTMLVLNQINEYHIKSVFLNNKRDFGGEGAQYGRNMDLLTNSLNQHCFIESIYDGSHSQHIAEFLEWLILNQVYNYAHPTTGILLCGIAVSLGYKEIYLAGIDFYRGKQVYAFDSLQKNLITLDKYMPFFIDSLSNQDLPLVESYHSKQFDLSCLEFLAEHYGVKFYSLCPQSPLSKYIPLANITHNTFTPQPKSQGYIKDVQLPPKEAYMQFLAPSYKTRLKEIEISKNNAKKLLKQNIYFRILHDLARLPSHLKLYLHYKLNKDKQ